MKQVALARRYIDVLGLARESPDALKLLNWTAPRFATSVCMSVAATSDQRRT